MAVVKEPWRHSSRFEALGQMLITNQHLDKLFALHTDLISRDMLSVPSLSLTDTSAKSRKRGPDDDEDDNLIVEVDKVMAEVKLAKTPCKLELYLTIASSDCFSARYSSTDYKSLSCSWYPTAPRSDLILLIQSVFERCH